MVEYSHKSIHSVLTFTNRLCDVRFTSVRVNLNLENVIINVRNGDFNATSLAQVVNTSTMNDLVVKTWIDRACMT